MEILKCIDLSYDGLGIVKVNGKTTFVENLLIGEEAEIEITSSKKNFNFAKIKKLHTKSDERMIPICKYFEECGGCSTMHLNSSAEKSFKKRAVMNTWQKNYKNNTKFSDLYCGKEKLYYRSKVIFPIQKRGSRIVSGPYIKGTHQALEIDNCLMLEETGMMIHQLFIKKLNELNSDIYDEFYHRGNIRSIMYRRNEKNEYMIVLIVRYNEKLTDIIEYLSTFTSVKSIYINLNPHQTNVLLGKKYLHVYGAEKLIINLCGIKYALSPQSFFQINYEITEMMFARISELADLNENSVVLDAYCGIGAIGLSLAKNIKFLYGVEKVEKAIVDAKHNAQLNNLSNTMFLAGDVMKHARDILSKVDTVIVDPSRKGCSKEFLELLIEKQVSKIIYMSCNPSTLARDASFLTEQGYNISEVELYDMFSQTSHVEAIVKITNS